RGLWFSFSSTSMTSFDQPSRACAFMLWGGPAGTYAKHLASHHLIHMSAHPSPLSVHRGFFGSRPFSKVNQWLIDRGQEPIHWADP
ncbi:MAG: uracil-DNA glycosylase, partial [Pseudomonadota bacterium]